MNSKGKFIGIVLSIYSFAVIAQDKSNLSTSAASVIQKPATAENSRTNGNAVISQNQPRDKADLLLLSDVQRAVLHDKSISLNGHNVKILVTNNVVVLRGPVNSEAEKAKLGDIATQIAGVSAVDNELEVKAR